MKRLPILLVALGLVAASACGGGGDDSSSASGSASGSAGEAAPGVFPVTLEHRSGSDPIVVSP